MCRVVFVPDRLQSGQIILSVARKDILLLGCVVLIQIRVVEALLLGGSNGPIDHVSRGCEDSLVIGSITP